MADPCFRCHGPDRNARMACLRLDIGDEALKPKSNGTAPIVFVVAVDQFIGVIHIGTALGFNSQAADRSGNNALGLPCCGA